MNERKLAWAWAISFLFLVALSYYFCDSRPWTKQFGTDSFTGANSVATDSSGNIYVAGYTDGGLDGNIGSGYNEAFVVKYSSLGKKQWTRQFGIALFTEANGIAIDSGGDIYVTGNTRDNGADGFLAKYNSDGVKQWTAQLGVMAYLGAGIGIKSVATDIVGNVYVVGETEEIVGDNANARHLVAFVGKYNSAGEKQWTKQFGTLSAKGQALFSGVAIGASGSIYLSGDGNGWVEGVTDEIGNGAFIMKLNSAGERQWARHLGYSHAHSIALDSNENIFVVGQGGTSMGGFVVKYSPSGEYQWAELFRDESRPVTRITSVVADSGGNIYVAGSTSLGLNGKIMSDCVFAFVVKLDSSGRREWTRQFRTFDVKLQKEKEAADSSGTKMGTLRSFVWQDVVTVSGITIDFQENIFVVGQTNGGLDGNINTGGWDTFIVKYNSAGERQ